VIAKLSRTLRETVAKPEVTAWIKDRTLEPATSTPEELAAVIKSDEVKYSQIIKQLNFSLD
jgi:tripartite-type tricarboxylate transporter receptor subunit TctC